MGGTGRLVEGLAGLIDGQGGALRLEPESRASRSSAAARPACAGVGETVAADIVVSNADSASTYTHLLAPSIAADGPIARIETARYSMGLFVWYFGTKKRYDDVEHHTILLGPRYRELLADIFTRHRLAEDFSLYLHRPTATDPSLAPPGCDAFYVLSPVPHLAAGTDWATQAEPYRQAIAALRRAHACCPASRPRRLVRMIDAARLPRRLSRSTGAAFGLEPVLTQSAWFRPHNASEEVENLFLVGAGTHPGAGLPGVLSSARILDKVCPEAHAFS